MAGAVSESQLTRPGVRFSLAAPRDDAEIRALLRDNPIRGSISISLEREPNYFIELPDETRTTIVAREGDNLACVGSCAFRSRYVNGEPRRVGYLGSLRLDSKFAGRFDILRRGYDFFRELQSAAPADFYFTSISSDNLRARHFLERGLRGMPAYEFITEFVTLVLPTRSALRFNAPFPGECQSPGDFQLAPCDPITETPVWDQRDFKQTVIRGYSPGLAMFRPLHNLFARGRLPAIGETLAIAFVTSFQNWGLPKLLRQARSQGLEYLSLGFAANDPRLRAMRNSLKAREYLSRLYIVRWPGVGGPAGELDERVVAPEAALL